MAKRPMEGVLRYLRNVVAPRTEADVSDGQLLQRFLHSRDEDAFAVLVRRHGRLVWDVCRHVLRQEQDAEDAFQATFLILADKAASIRKRASIASWLHGVALRVAWNARKSALHRLKYECRAEERSVEPAVNAAALREVQTILDEEVQRLPEKYRAPFVLCCLQGKSREEAARELGWKEGTLSSRLALARERLQQRLTRRGVTLTAALSAAAIAGNDAAALPIARAIAAAGKLPVTVSVQATILAKGVLKSMMLTRMKIGAGLVLLFGSLMAGGAVAIRQVETKKQPQPQPQAESKPAEQQRAAVDVHGDPLPPGAVVRLGTTRFRAGGNISALAFSPDGKTIASSSGDGIIRLWDAASGKQTRELPRLWANTFPLAFRPDGKILAAGLTLYDVASGKQVATMTPPRLDPLYGEATSVAFSPDGKLLATGERKTARLWDAASGKQLRKLDVCRNFNPVPCVAFSPDGKTLATGGYCDEHALRLWDVATGKERFGVRGNPASAESFGVRGNPANDNGSLKALAFAPDGKTLATLGDYQNTIRLWDAANGRELQQFRGHTAPPSSLAFSPDGKQILSCGGRNFDPALPPDNTVRVWDVAGGKEQHRLTDEGASLVAFSPDGKTIASTWGSAIRLWDTATGKPADAQLAPQGRVQCLALAPDGKTIATRTPEGISIWDAAGGKELRRLAGEKGGGKIAFAPDGRLLAVPEEDGSIRFWDALTGREQKQRRLQGHKGKVNEVVFFPDGKRLLSAGEDGTTRLWNMADGKEIRQMIGRTPGQPIKGIPGGTMAPMPANAAIRVECVALAPDGKTLASGCSDNTVRVWDSATGKQVQQLAEQGSVTAVAFSPDGRLLASVGGKIRLWELASGKVRTEIFGHSTALAFSPDGRTLASSAWERTHETNLWDVRSGKLWGRLAGHRGPILSLAYSRDGKRLATGSADTTVLLWDMSDLTPQRRRQMLALPSQELEDLWLQMATTLVTSSGPTLSAEVWRLSTVPQQSVPFLAKRLRPKVLDRKKIPQWIADLESKDRQVVYQAMDNLMEVGDAAKPPLRAALKGKLTAQGREVIEVLLEGGLQGGGPLDADEERAMKAVEVLRLIDNAESRALLQKLAGGTPSARLTRAAAAALRGKARTPTRRQTSS
jgi:RNA polymerase sigma factor (sigma-70 family)